jgi:hypothetical protein
MGGKRIYELEATWVTEMLKSLLRERIALPEDKLLDGA